MEEESQAGGETSRGIGWPPFLLAQRLRAVLGRRSIQAERPGAAPERPPGKRGVVISNGIVDGKRRIGTRDSRVPALNWISHCLGAIGLGEMPASCGVARRLAACSHKYGTIRTDEDNAGDP